MYHWTITYREHSVPGTEVFILITHVLREQCCSPEKGTSVQFPGSVELISVMLLNTSLALVHLPPSLLSLTLFNLSLLKLLATYYSLSPSSFQRSHM